MAAALTAAAGQRRALRAPLSRSQSLACLLIAMQMRRISTLNRAVPAAANIT